jgi:hypothetical protein
MAAQKPSIGTTAQYPLTEARRGSPMTDGFPSHYVILVVPPGAESAPISHGDQSYHAWREDHRDPGGKWLVAVPLEVAKHLTWNGGFSFYDPDK